LNARAYVSKFNFSGTDQSKKLEVLSGGERNRVHLAIALKQGSNVLLLDEPTNDIDVNTLRALEEAIENFAGCAVIISHDRHFLNQVCTHMADLDYGKIAVYPGNYDDFMEASTQARERQQAQSLAERVAAVTLTFTAKAGESGRLYGSITSADIAAALEQTLGQPVDKRDIVLEHPIREVGVHSVALKLLGDIRPEIKVVVNHEEQYSIWPQHRENALGWSDAGKAGTKQECLDYIKEVWTDMRPLSLRKRMEEAAGKG